MIDWFISLFVTLKAENVAKKNLKEMRLQLLENQAKAMYYAKMVEYCENRINSLQNFPSSEYRVTRIPDTQ